MGCYLVLLYSICPRLQIVLLLLLVLVGRAWCQNVSDTTERVSPPATTSPPGSTTPPPPTPTVTADPAEFTEPATTPSDELLADVQDLLDPSCCLILNIDCDLVFSVMETLKRRKKREAAEEESHHHEEPLAQHTIAENLSKSHNQPHGSQDVRLPYGAWSPQHAGETSTRTFPDSEERDFLEASSSSNSGGRRQRREVNLSDRFVDQLGINLLRFETCLCQAATAPSTCRMLYPPDFYQPSTPQMFITAFQEKDGLKRMTCSFYSGSVVDCTFDSSVLYDENMTSEVTRLMEDQRAASLLGCVACTPLSCTFDVFKRRLQPTNTTFNEDYNTCFDDATAARLEATPTSQPPKPITTPSPAPPPTFPPLPTVGTPTQGGERLAAAEFYHQMSFAIFPVTPTRESIFPTLSKHGIFLGIGRLGGNTTMTELYGLSARGPSLVHSLLNHHDHHDHDHGRTGHDDHSVLASQMPVIIGAIAGGLLAGALLMAILIFVLYRKRLVVRRAKVGRSLRDMPIVKLDSDNLTPLPSFMGPDMQPPVARVPPMMTVSPRRPSDLGFSSLSSRAGSLACSPRLSTDSLLHACAVTNIANTSATCVPNPYLIEGEDGQLGDHYNHSYEDTEQLSTGIYSSVDDEEVDMDNGHDTVITSTSTTPLTTENQSHSGAAGGSSSNYSKISGDWSRGVAGGRSPRTSRVPEVPVFVAPAPRRKFKNKAKRGSNKSSKSSDHFSISDAAIHSNQRARPRHTSTASEQVMVKPPVLPKPCLSLPRPEMSGNSSPPPAILTSFQQKHQLKRPKSAPVASHQPKHKTLSVAPSLQPTSSTDRSSGADGVFPPSSVVDHSSHYEIPVVPKGKKPQRGPVGPPSVPPPPIPSIPAAAKRGVPAVPNSEPNAAAVLPSVPPLPKMRGVGKRVPPVPPMRSQLPRESQSSEVSTRSSRCDSDWSHCAHWDTEELETDFSDMENEYMEIKPDPEDSHKDGEGERELAGYSKIY